MDYLKKIIKSIKKKTIKIEDLFYLNELLKTNLPLKSCLMLLRNDTNKDLFDSLIEQLEKGFLIEEIINDYLPKEISKYMLSLLKKLSFNESLQLSLMFYQKSKENLKRIEKSLSYPIILLFISLTALYLFDYYALDSIIDLMRSFNIDVKSFSSFRVFIKVLIYLFYFAFIVISIIVLYFFNPKRINIFYLLICRYFKNGFIQMYFTNEFVDLLIISLRLGYKTKDALEILKSLDNKPIVALLAFHLEDKLLEGNSLKEASNQRYFDGTLEKFINIASFSKNFIDIMNNYVELTNEKLINKIKFFTKLLQGFSYVVIGIVIIFIYQVLFLPMQAIITL